MRVPTQKRAPFLFAVTALTTLFMVAPMLLSIFAGLVNNYSVGIKSGFTLRWLTEVWEVYGGTVGWSLVIAAASVLATAVIGVPLRLRAGAQPLAPGARL